MQTFQLKNMALNVAAGPVSFMLHKNNMVLRDALWQNLQCCLLLPKLPAYGSRHNQATCAMPDLYQR